VPLSSAGRSCRFKRLDLEPLARCTELDHVTGIVGVDQLAQTLLEVVTDD
jgi:hypothetical protein